MTTQTSTRKILKMRVREIRDYTPRIRELFIDCLEPAEFKFRAGQFVVLHVPAPGQPKPLLRSYSIASTDERQDGFRLIFNLVESGHATQYVWSLVGGETLEFTGPFGRLYFKEPPTEQVIFLNTGSGISQHYCYLESNIRKFPDLKYRLLFGARSESDIYYRDELEKLKASLKNFSYDYVLSRPSPNWKGKTGYVQAHLADYEHLKIPTTFYLCGNRAMIKDVRAQLEKENFDATKILAEAFD